MIVTNISGHNMEITTPIKDHINDRLELLKSHFDKLNIDIILKKERQSAIIHATTTFRGKRISISSTHQDMYAAIGDAMKKLNRVIRKQKEKFSSNIRRQPKQTIITEVPFT